MFSQNRIDSLLNLLDETKYIEHIDLLNEIASAYNELNNSKESILFSEKALKSATKIKNVRGKIVALNNLASSNLVLRKATEALNYSNQAIALSYKNEDKRLRARALRNLSSASLSLGEKDSVLVKLKQALAIYSDLSDSMSIGIVFSEMGEAYTYLNNTPQMVTSYLHALEIFEKLEDEERIALIYLNLGSVYSNILGEYKKAIEYGYQALEIYNKLGDEVKKTYCYLIIGSAHEYLGNLEKALELYNKSLEICSRTDNKYLLANTENYIGEAYNKQHNIESALDSYSKSLKIYSELSDYEGIAVAENNIGECYYKLGEFNKALTHYTRSFNYFDKRGEKFQLSELLVNIGNVYHKRRDYKSAINSYNRSINYAKETNALESLKEAYAAMAHVYKDMQNPGESLNYLELFVEVKDSLINLENLATIADYEAKYETSEKEKEIELLKKEHELTEVNVMLQKILIHSLVLISLLLIATVVIYFRKYRQKNNLNQKLAESETHLQKLNFTKDKFFSIIAHDLRGPLGTLSGLTEILDEDAEEMDKKSIIDLSRDINQISKNTINLLNNLLTWASVQIGKIETSKESFDIYNVVDSVYQLLKENINQKNISFTNEIPNGVTVYADQNMISLVIRNLLHNAIKFTNEDGNINVTSVMNNGHISISISDNGVGITEENIGNLFEIGSKSSTYGTANESGTGLGLILTKEFIEKNGGSIEVKSQVGKGTTFTTNLPYSRN
jgi:signal transduction histidine kinase